MGWTCHELEPLDTWVQEAAEQVQRMNDEARKEQKHSWAKFLQQAAQGQAGLLHKLSKPVVRWAPRPSLEHHGDTQDPQVAVVAVVEEWAKEWRVDSVLQLQQRPWETCQVEPMEPITAEEVWKAGSHFKVHTGVGVDLLHPKLFSTLSRPGAQAVADLLNRVEAERQ